MFWLAAPGHAVVALVDATGADVLRVADAHVAAGTHVVALAAAAVPAGFSQCRLTAAGQSVSRPVAVVHVATLPS